MDSHIRGEEQGGVNGGRMKEGEIYGEGRVYCIR